MPVTLADDVADLAAELRARRVGRVDDSTLARALYSADASLYRVVPRVVVRPVGLLVETPETTLEPISAHQVSQLQHHMDPEQFLDVWHWRDWNRITVRCEGVHPVLTSWINGVKAYQLDTGTMSCPNYDREAVSGLLGHAGHIALEVHDNEWPGMGEARWAPGAVVRWRDITIDELNA